MRKPLAYTMAALLSAATASIAIAQPAPGPAPQRRFEDRPFSRPTERVEARLAYVKTALKITDAQQPQWNAYADAVRKNAKDIEQRMQSRRDQPRTGDRGRGQRPNALERLERLQSFHADAVTRINDLLAAEKPLYAALTPEQKRVADVVLAPGGMGRDRMMRAMMMHRGGFGRG